MYNHYGTLVPDLTPLPMPPTPTPSDGSQFLAPEKTWCEGAQDFQGAPVGIRAAGFLGSSVAWGLGGFLLGIPFGKKGAFFTTGFGVGMLWSAYVMWSIKQRYKKECQGEPNGG